MLTAKQAPAALHVDGQLTEWEVFADGKPSALTPSFVVVAVRQDSVVIAGRIRNVSEQGLWLRLEAEGSELPPIGSFQRGGGVAPLYCDVPPEEGGYLPFDSETCHQLLDAYEELKKSHAASFVRQLHLTARAVSIRTGEQEEPLTAGEYAFRTEAGAVTFEAVLPLRALPRTSSAELSWLIVEPRRADSGPAAETLEGMPHVFFEPPIRFGMDSDLLACLSRADGGGWMRNPRFSYQPGVPNSVFRTGHANSFLLETSEVTLSSREATLGSIEVRAVHGSQPLVAIFKEGQLVECSSVGEVLGVVERGRGLHVIGYEQVFQEDVGVEGADFKILEIEKDGTLHDDLLEPSEGFAYAAVGQEHAKNLARFSISGTYRTSEGGSQPHTLSWQYDARLNRYGLRERKGRYAPPVW